MILKVFQIQDKILADYKEYARKADYVATQKCRDLIKQILHDSLDGIEIRPDMYYENIFNYVLSLGVLSNNPGLQKVGKDSSKKIIQKDKNLKKLSNQLDTATTRIDSFSFEKLVIILEQLNKWGVETAINYILTGRKLIKKDII